jgi:hypothetical protein
VKNAVNVSGAVFLLLVGCQNSDPVERQADAYEAAGRNAADVITTEAAARAAGLDNEASALDQNASAVGGFTEKKLDVRADALRSEAEIVKDQGEAAAAAVKADADAKAKELRAR